MLIPNEAYTEFTQIYEREFGIKLPHEEAKFKAKKLLNIFRKAILNNTKQGEINNGQ